MARGGKREGAGRKAGTASKKTMDAAVEARKYGPLALRTLARIMRSGKYSEGARVAAAREVLDRGYGRPTQSHLLGNLNDVPLKLVTGELSAGDAAAAYQATLNSTKK